MGELVKSGAGGLMGLLHGSNGRTYNTEAV